MGGNNRTNPITIWWKGLPKPFSVVSDVFFPIESISTTYIFVLWQLIRLFNYFLYVKPPFPPEVFRPSGQLNIVASSNEINICYQNIQTIKYPDGFDGL